MLYGAAGRGGGGRGDGDGATQCPMRLVQSLCQRGRRTEIDHCAINS